MNVELDRKEIAGLMRALLRSLEKTPEKERKQHEELYSKISALHAEALGPGVWRKLRRKIGEAREKGLR